MRIILLGPPGAGKGTQSTLLAGHFSIPAISTGDMLRTAIREKNPTGLTVQALMESGALVPDAIIIDLVKARIAAPACAVGFLLDGFPRNIAQAEALDQSGVVIDHVILLVVPDRDIIQRMSGRLVHLPSGRVYHRDLNPPKVATQDDVTGESLVQRKDDSEETVRHRLQVYAQQTEPLVDYYREQASVANAVIQWHEVNGVGDVDTVQKRLLETML